MGRACLVDDQAGDGVHGDRAPAAAVEGPDPPGAADGLGGLGESRGRATLLTWRRRSSTRPGHSHSSAITTLCRSPASTGPTRRGSSIARMRKRRPFGRRLAKMSRRRPTLPPGLPGSTIGARGLNFRVRDGTGCLPSAMATETLWSCPRSTGNLQNYTASACKRSSCQVLGLLVPVSSTHYCASTSGLSTQSSSWGPYQVDPVGDLILERASRLYAFSAYPFRT